MLVHEHFEEILHSRLTTSGFAKERIKKFTWRGSRAVKGIRL